MSKKLTLNTDVSPFFKSILNFFKSGIIAGLVNFLGFYSLIFFLNFLDTPTYINDYLLTLFDPTVHIIAIFLTPIIFIPLIILVTTAICVRNKTSLKGRSLLFGIFTNSIIAISVAYLLIALGIIISIILTTAFHCKSCGLADNYPVEAEIAQRARL